MGKKKQTMCKKPKYRDVLMIRHDRVISIIKNKSSFEILAACMFKNVERKIINGVICIDVSATNFKCWDCLEGNDHEPHDKTQNINFYKEDVALIKQIIDLPPMIIQTCLIKNKGDLVETIYQLQQRNYNRMVLRSGRIK